jgi:RNA polymerase sigma-70 factor (ECF subfamily)
VTDGPERATERAEEARRIRDALLALPGEQRRAIEMAYFAGLTRREIAASGTASVGTVKSRMRLGMKKLASALTDHHVTQPRADMMRPLPSRPRRAEAES